MMGAQASNDQYEKILSYIDIGKKEGAEVLTGGGAAKLNSGLENGYYIEPTIFKGNREPSVCHASSKVLIPFSVESRPT